ncbi:MAG: hypothetical protein Q9169_005387 [Polycauliona sp. 2 TL-2023]
MAGIIGIYGLVVSVLISDGLRQDLPLYTSFIQLGAGLSVGLAGLAAGYAVSFLLLSPNSSYLPIPFHTIKFAALPFSILVLTLKTSFAIGIVGDAGVRGTAQQPRLFVGMILILIFAEVLGLYGLIVALLMNSKAAMDLPRPPNSKIGRGLDGGASEGGGDECQWQPENDKHIYYCCCSCVT